MARRLGVALEPFGHVDVADDVRSVVAPRGGVLENGRGTERMVVVAVGVDHVADGQVGQVPQLLDHPGAVGEQTGVDHGDRIGTEEKGRVAEAGQEVHAGGDLP